MYHYVYMLTHITTGEFYIGVRSSDVPPPKDDYMGSMVTWKVNKNMLEKQILAICINRRIAEIVEKSIIKEANENKLNRNFTLGGEKRKKYIEQQELISQRIFDMTVDIWNDIK